MKLASLKEGGRDGTLIIVKRNLTEAAKVGHIAPTLQVAIENWDVIAPKLQAEFERLEAGEHPDAFPFVVDDLASPLPRAYQFLDGSVYLHHMKKARAARGAAMPPNYETDPLMYQALSHGFCGPTEPMRFPSEELKIDFEGEVAVVLDDVPMGVTAEEAGKHIKLIMLLNDYTLRALTKTELPKGFGFMQAKPTSSFSPVAVTLDELGEAWDGNTVHLPVVSNINGKWFGHPNAGQDMWFTYPQLIAHAARTRELAAGTIIAAGTVSNASDESGYGCISEAQTDEKLKYGAPKTNFLKFGDTVRVEMFDEDGNSIFGAIENQMAPFLTESVAVNSHAD